MTAHAASRALAADERMLRWQSGGSASGHLVGRACLGPVDYAGVGVAGPALIAGQVGEAGVVGAGVSHRLCLTLKVRRTCPGRVSSMSGTLVGLRSAAASTATATGALGHDTLTEFATSAADLLKSFVAPNSDSMNTADHSSKQSWDRC